jgi:hypothetical protein
VSDSKLRLAKPKLTNHPVDVGQRTEAAILSELVRRGYSVLLPFGVNQRYDLVLDLDGKFVRAQCKTGRLRNGVVFFSTKSVQSNTRRAVIRNYDGDADVLRPRRGSSDDLHLPSCQTDAQRPEASCSLGVRLRVARLAQLARAPDL